MGFHRKGRKAKPRSAGEGTHPPVVFVPALFGSELLHAGKRGKKAYVEIPIALGARTPDLALPLAWSSLPHDGSSRGSDRTPDSTNGSSPTQERDRIAPGGALESIRLFGRFGGPIVMDQYGMFCRQMRRRGKREGYEFRVFGYDWRRDLNETADGLLRFLRDIKSDCGKPPVVISHSMGCLVALAALHTDPSSFGGSLMAGGNFGGGAGFYPTNTEGMAVGRNRKYLGPEVVHTFPSMYAAASPALDDPLLKRTDEETGDTRHLFRFVDFQALRDRKEKVEVPIDMFEIQHWKQYKLGPWSILESGEKMSDEMNWHVQTCLQQGMKFQRRVRNVVEPTNGDQSDPSRASKYCYPPVAVLVGDGYTNPDHFLWDVESSQWMPWTDELLRDYPPERYEKTDGTVSLVSASQPPGLAEAGVTVREYRARMNGPGMGTHRELLNELDLVEKILDDIVRDEPKVREDCAGLSVQASSRREGSSKMPTSRWRDIQCGLASSRAALVKIDVDGKPMEVDVNIDGRPTKVSVTNI